MGFQKDFAEILAEKLGPLEEKGASKAPKLTIYPQYAEPILYFNTNKKSWFPQYGLKSYPKKQGPQGPQGPQTPHIPFVEAITQTKFNEKIWTIDDFELEWKLYFSRFKKMGANIDKSHIRLSLVKKEFRKLAKRLHPDHATHPSSLLFQDLKEIYGYLRSEIDKKSKD